MGRICPMGVKGLPNFLPRQNMASRDSLSSDMMCVMCNKSVVKNTVFCKVCSAPYHPSCADRTTLLPNKGFSKCCLPK